MFEVVNFLLIVDEALEDLHAVVVHICGVCFLLILHASPDEVIVSLLTFEEDFGLFDEPFIDVLHTFFVISLLELLLMLKFDRYSLLLSESSCLNYLIKKLICTKALIEKNKFSKPSM